LPAQGTIETPRRTMLNLTEMISDYVHETRKLESLPSSTETSFYPDLKTLLNAVLKSERLSFDVMTGTSESGARPRGMPDFVLGDWSLFAGVYGEVKRADTTLGGAAARNSPCRRSRRVAGWTMI